MDLMPARRGKPLASALRTDCQEAPAGDLPSRKPGRVCHQIYQSYLMTCTARDCHGPAYAIL